MIVNKKKIKKPKKYIETKKTMAQHGFGGLTHWGLKPRIGYTSPPPRLKRCTSMRLSLGVGSCEECAGGGWGLNGRVRMGASRIGSIPKYTVSIQMGFI